MERIKYSISLASLVAQMANNLPAVQTWVQSLGWEDSLEKGMVTHSAIHAWEIQWTEKPGRLQSVVSQSQSQLSNEHCHFLWKS